MNAPVLTPPPRFGPLTPQTWPQDENRVPNTPGLSMPPVSASNRERSRRESFTLSGTIDLGTTWTAGKTYRISIPTDKDGDFWCDQIYVAAWSSAQRHMSFAPPSTLMIRDMRTDRALTYPETGVPTKFFETLLAFSDDPGFDPGASPLPDGFRSTTTLPQSFCFTRSGGIIVTLTTLGTFTGPPSATVDIAFGGWKEYEYASA